MTVWQEMRDRVKRLHEDNSGAALMVALVIILVLFALSASILLVAYSLHGTALKQNRSIQCHELALSVSETLKNQLYAEGMNAQITDAFTFKTAMENGWIQENYPLWYYMRTQILQGDNVWRYYDESEQDFAHTSQMAFRELKLDFGGEYTDQLFGYDLKVTMYWISTKKEAAGDPNNVAQRYRSSSPLLVLVVECSQGDIRSVVTSKYDLSVGNFDQGIREPEEGEEYTIVLDKTKVVYWNENWRFTLRSMK